MSDLLASRPAPPSAVVLLALAVAAALVLAPASWPWARTLATIAHEGGHAVAALATGRRLAGIRLHSDTSGVTISFGPARGAGMIVTLLAGYPAPSLLGLAAAATLATGRVTATLTAVLILLGLILLQIRNFYGLLALLLTGGLVLGVSHWATTTMQGAFAYALTWFLLISGPRTVWELSRSRMGRRTPNSDVDQLARLTHVPAVFWLTVLAVATLLPLVAGLWLLL